MEPALCDVCGQEAPNGRVVCSSLGPMSFRYCRRCGEEGAEPYGALVYAVALSYNEKTDGLDLLPLLHDIVRATLPIVNKTTLELFTDAKEAYHRIKAEYARDTSLIEEPTDAAV